MGLFDAQGNVYTWCQEGFADYPRPTKSESVVDQESKLAVDLNARVLRGSGFTYQASDVRSARRSGLVPVNRVDIVGIRPARTLPLSSFTALKNAP